VPTTIPSAPSSRHRSNSTSSNDFAAGIVLYVSRGMSANSLSNARSSYSTCAIVLAVAAVSASGVSAMKSGTAMRVGAPGPPVIVVVMSLGCWGGG
jgi:hypothetical protein